MHLREHLNRAFLHFGRGINGGHKSYTCLYEKKRYSETKNNQNRAAAIVFCPAFMEYGGTVFVFGR